MRKFNLISVLLTLLFLTSAIFAEVPQLVNYQGRLTDNPSGDPVNSTVSMTFTIYDASTEGNIIWSEPHTDVMVSEGLFNVLLGSTVELVDTVFNDTTRYLGITVAGNAEIIPRKRLVTIPYAYRVATVDGASGGTISGKLAIGPECTNTGEYAFVAGWHNTADGYIATIGGGESNTASGSRSTVGGGQFNWASGLYSTIGGGYYSAASTDYSTVSGGFSNAASAAASTISGGANNNASEYGSAIGGGANNTASGGNSLVAGGSYNISSGGNSIVSGGYENTANGFLSTIGGGGYNEANGYYSTVSGGYNNTISASADYSYLFGINSTLTEDSTFMVDMPHVRIGDETTGYELPNEDGTPGQVMATDGSGQVGWVEPTGGSGGWTDGGSIVRLETSDDSVGIGTASPTEKLHVDGNILVTGTANIGFGHTLTGNYGFVAGYGNTVSGDTSTVSGGTRNSATGLGSTISGGVSNDASGDYSVIAGGRWQEAAGLRSTICGGQQNDAIGDNSTIIGGREHVATGAGSVIAGGLQNRALSTYDIVSGGYMNVASGGFGTIGGGRINTAPGHYGTVSGGRDNTASGYSSTVAGGDSNYVAGNYCTVGGGSHNAAGESPNDNYATVPGGAYNTAIGRYSFAAGRKAKAMHHGAFVWANSTDADFASTGDNQFLIRAGGGVGINTNSPHSDLQVEGSIAKRVTVITDDYTVANDDCVILVSAMSSINITLPSASGVLGRVYTLKNTTIPEALIYPVVTENLDGSTVSISISYNAFITIVSDGSDWWIIARN